MNAHPASLSGTITLGSTVRHDRDEYEVFDELRAAGWQTIGDGTYTTVFLSPDGSRVLKFADGAGQKATVAAALANPDNPHLPRVYGVMELEGDYPLAYEAEALQPLTDEDELYEYDDDGEYAEPRFAAWAQQWSPELFEWSPERFKGRPNGPMKDAVRALLEAADDYGAGLDIHPGNVMVRPSTGELVLNDLLA